MSTVHHKTFMHPEEVREFSHGKVENLHFEDGVVGRMTLQPGWAWSKDVKPTAGTELCQVAHFSYQTSGILHVRMADGSEYDFGPQDVSVIPPGHDAWVIGNEPVVIFDWTGVTAGYAKPSP